jgi:hypothetical protein
MSRTKPLVFPLAAVLALGLAACASSPSGNRTMAAPDRVVDVEQISIPEYREFLAELANAVESDIPREFNDKEMEQFNEVSVELDRLLANYDSREQMDQDSLVRLYNLHSELEAVVVGRDENQVLCRRRHRVGTNFKVTECKSVNEWRYEQDMSQEFIRNMMTSDAGRPPPNAIQ